MSQDYELQTPRWKLTDCSPNENFFKLSLATPGLITKSKEPTNAEVNVHFTESSLEVTALVTPKKSGEKKIKYGYKKATLPYEIVPAPGSYYELDKDKIRVFLKKQKKQKWNSLQGEFNPDLDD